MHLLRVLGFLGIAILLVTAYASATVVLGWLFFTGPNGRVTVAESLVPGVVAGLVAVGMAVLALLADAGVSWFGRVVLGAARGMPSVRVTLVVYAVLCLVVGIVWLLGSGNYEPEMALGTPLLVATLGLPALLVMGQARAVAARMRPSTTTSG